MNDNKKQFAEKKKDFDIAHENQPLPYRQSFQHDWIETELEHHLSYMEIVKRVSIDKKREITLFCPRCIGIICFRIDFMRDPYTNTEFEVLVCPQCNSHFSDRFWDSDYTLSGLMHINDRVSKYQKNSNRVILLQRESA